MGGKRILVIYYSQTGQIKRIIDSVLSQLDSNRFIIDFAQIKPIPEFPFPWSSDQFFQAFPESFLGIPCNIEPLQVLSEGNLKPLIDINYDLVILGYSPWFLSPSIPVQSFLNSEQAGLLLKDKSVVTIIGCRNMWLQSQERIKKYLLTTGAKLAGNIVLRDRSPNLISVITIIRWMLKGRKEKTSLFPAAGISVKDIKAASRFGNLISSAVTEGKFDNLQENLISTGAVSVNPSLLLFERNGSRIFSMWASRIIKKGPYGDPGRRTSLRLFKYYLLAVLFVISPVANLVYFFVRIFIIKKVRKDIRYFSYNSP